MSKKILVTGGAGYIGSHTVVSLYQSGFKPIIIDNLSNSRYEALEGIEKIVGEKPTFYQIDCNDMAGLQSVCEKEGEIFGIIHFAAYKSVGESVAEPLKYYRSNLQCLVNILELMDSRAIKNLVFSSTCAVYGEPQLLPVSEEELIVSPKSPYGNTKKVGEEIIYDFCKAKKNINVTLLRYFNPIGAHPSAAIGEFPLGVPATIVPIILQTAAGIRNSFTVFGDDYNTPDGTCIRDYIDIMDLASAHVKALEWLSAKTELGECEVFNIGTGRGQSVFELIHAFEKLTSITLNYSVVARRDGDIEMIYANPNKANTVLNWHSEYSIEHSLANAWRWQQNI